MSKKQKTLNNNELENIQITENESYTQSYTHKNPNEYNGETLDNQVITSKNISKKLLYLEGYVCL